MALDAGYVHLDTAAMYGNERHVGDVIGRYMAYGQRARSDFFVGTKVAHPPLHRLFPEPSRGETAHMLDPAADSRDATKRQFVGCLERLGLAHVDLLLLHWPGPRPGEYDPEAYDAAANNRRKRREMWAALEDLFDQKLALAIGVSNFTERHLNELLEDGARVVPHVNQTEVHPYLAQESLVKFCKLHDIVVTASSPLGRGTNIARQVSPLLDAVIAEIAQARGWSPAQVILRWLLQRGLAVIPKSGTPERMVENLRVAELSELSEAELERISGLDRGARVYPDPEQIP